MVVFKKDIDFTSFLPLLAIICILLAAYFYASVKSIEVRKYQETWARHQNAFFLMQSEMVKYCNHLSPYDKPGDDIDKLFMERIMAVLEINNSKFVANMENKEMQLSDLPGKIIVKNWALISMYNTEYTTYSTQRIFYATLVFMQLSPFDAMRFTSFQFVVNDIKKFFILL